MTNVRHRRILLLCAEAARHTGTVNDHISAFQKYSQNYVCVFDCYGAHQYEVDLSLFDCIVFHYSIVIALPSYIPREFERRIAAFTGPKILFIQDEFRWVNRTMEAAERLAISVVFTVVNAEAVRKIYRNPYFDKVRFEQTLTGFVPDELIDRPVPPFVDRRLDVSYRARKLPGWCGSFALQKWQIGERFLVDAKRYGLTSDIATSEASRIYGEEWIEFVANSKATLGTESGASFIDYTGDVHKAVSKFEAAHPDATFEEVRDRFLEGRDGDVVIHVISPRVFEAICLRTLLILYPAEYSGVLVPWRHYIPLARDHSNMDEVVAILRDPVRASEIIDNAYEEVAKVSTWTYRNFIAQFDKLVEELVTPTFETLAQETERVWDARSQELELAAEYYARRAVRRMKILLWLQSIKKVANDVLTHRLPKPIGKPLLSAGRATSRTLKPFIRNIMLGRSD